MISRLIAIAVIALLALPPALAEEDAARVFASDIRFIVRTDAVAEDELRPLVAGLVGRELGLDDIRQALDGIAGHCAGQGRPIRAILPQQSFRGGVVRVVITAGRPEPGLEFPSLAELLPLPIADGPSMPVPAEREQRLVADVIAARYRVARTAVEPVVVAAYRAGRESALDPLLILAVIAIESSFRPAAISVVGARGLMQVMPKYHMDKIARHGDAQVLFDPKTNVLVGAKILHEYMQRFGGTVFALQRYVGAFNDSSYAYARKVLAERSLFERVVARL